jgi:predicted nucleic acid-binding protein
VILVDTSVWVDHFRRGNARLKLLLEDGETATHPMVLGELACGNLPRRRETLHLLESLPAIPQAPDRLVREAIETRRLWGKGIGWIDAHLVVASLISGVPLWTLDRRLARVL